MTPKQLIDSIFKTNKITIDNETIELHSNIDQNEGEFLSNIIEENKYKKSIEIGCAYGISSLFICDALSKSDSPLHYIIDPHQNSYWKGVGLKNLNICNIDYFKLIEKVSEIALPELLANKEKFDFAFIDGWHTFDHTLIDFFYLNRLIEVGGTIVIDDVGMPAVNKFASYVMNYPAYEVVGAVEYKVSSKRSLYNKFIFPFLKFVIKIFPRRLRNELFNGKYIHSQNSYLMQASMVAFRKVKEDEREWHWYETF